MTTSKPRPQLRPLALLWLAGVVVILVTMTIAALLNQTGHFVLAMTGSIVCALTLIPLGIRIAGSGSRESDWGVVFTVAFCGVVIAIAASFAGQDEVVLFGTSARDVVAARAPETGSAFLHFRDAKVLIDQTVRVPVYARESLKSRMRPHIAYYAAFAPVVDRRWAPDQPVAAFAFIGSPTLGHRTKEWRQPWNAGIRANGVHAHEWDIALGKFQAQDGITVAAGAVVVRWSLDPEGQAAAARGRLLTAALIATAIWSLALIIGLVVALRRQSRRAGLHHFYNQEFPRDDDERD